MARHQQFLPKGSIAGGGLPWVTGVMVFLSALAGGFGLALHGMFDDWSQDLEHRISIQIVAPEKEDREMQIPAVLALLEDVPGIAEAKLLSTDETMRLLEPWLGAAAHADDLPIPALIDVRIASGMRVDPRALEAALIAVAPGARVDDHQDWLLRLERLARTFEAVSALVVALILAATAAIAVFGTRAGLASHSETIAILHHMGATDSMIAAEFRRRFMIQGLKGAIGGLAMAMLLILLAGSLAGQIGGGLVPSMRLEPTAFALLLVLPVFAAFLTMIAAHLTVRHDLARMP